MTGTAFLEMLDPDDRAALLRAGRPHRYRSGTSIITQGDRTDTLFVVRSGSAKVVRTAFAEPERTTNTVSVLSPWVMMEVPDR